MKLFKRNLYLPTALMALGIFTLGAGSFAEARPALENVSSDARIEQIEMSTLFYFIAIIRWYLTLSFGFSCCTTNNSCIHFFN